MKCPKCGEEIAPVIIASGKDFEKYLCDEINTLANVKCEMTKASGDQGADLLVTLSSGKKIAIQCKLYSSPVGNDAVQEVMAGKVFYKCDMACVVSNNTYTSSAIELARCAEVELLHHSELKNYINECNGGLNKNIIRELQELELYLCHIGKQNVYSRELEFVVSHSIREEFSHQEWLDGINSVLDELTEHERRPMNVTMKYFYEFFYNSPCCEVRYMSEPLREVYVNTVFPSLEDAMPSCRADAHKYISLTDEDKILIDLIPPMWVQVLKLSNEVEELFNKFSWRTQFDLNQLPKLVSAYIPYVSYTDITKLKKDFCDYLIKVGNFYEKMSGTSIKEYLKS